MKITPGRKLYSIFETYRILYDGLRTMKYLSEARKDDLLDKQFIERIMLAVTEVNGCAICSYAHTRMALESGMSNQEIAHILSGTTDDTPADQLSAILFAQHYAENRARPSEGTWQRIVERYGIKKARGVLAAIRIIMIGNAYGIAFSSFANRFKGKPDERSSLLYEIGMILCGIISIPIVLIHTLIAAIFQIPLLRFSK